MNLNSPLEVLFSSRKTKTYQALKDAGVDILEQLIYVFPKRLDWIPDAKSFADLEENAIFKGRGIIKDVKSVPQYYSKRRGKTLLKNLTVIVEDLESDSLLTLRWFNSYPQLEKKLLDLEEITFFGKVGKYKGKFQIINPTLSEDHVKIDYPDIGEAKGFQIKKVIQKIPQSVWDEIKESIPSYILKKRQLPDLSESLQMIHGLIDYADQQKAFERLQYEQYFNHQLKIILRKKMRTKNKAPLLKNIPNDLFKILPFELTEDQFVSINDIIKDIGLGYPMMRLLQGDVGCGKTAIALLATKIFFESNFQIAILCPTEALANQHFEEFEHYFKKAKILLGSTPAQEKREIYEGISVGTIKVIVGTHSLLQEGIEFKNLGLFIIDEQHKFGVEQRNYLLRKYPRTHSLIMSATPIPRSLKLTQFGDLEISTIKTLPSFKKPIQSRIVTQKNFSKFLGFVHKKLEQGEQAFFVVPKIDDEDSSLNNLEVTIQRLNKIFSQFNIQSLHGRMLADEKVKIINQFKNKKIDILVSTTVIEVGINIPNATLMAVLNPERFGLSTLHQLRGRVGRGQLQGYFFLIQENNISDDSKARLKILEEHSDGFLIAEKDLEIRGQGDLFGTNQSGSTFFEFDINTLHQVQEDIEEILEKDKDLLVQKLKENYQMKQISSTL